MQRVFNGLLAALLLVSIGAYLAVPRTEAFVIWCWDDPVIQHNNQTVQIRIGIQGEPADVAGIVATIAVSAAPGATTRVLATTNRYFTEQVVFVSRGKAGQVDVSFSGAKASLPVQMEIRSGNYASVSIGDTKRGVAGSFPVD